MQDTLTTTHNDEFIGEVNGKRYYLGPEVSEPMTQKEARNWCASLGGNFELPSRIVMLMCYNNAELRNQFRMDNFYWTNDDYGYNSSHGWVQFFRSGFQDYFTKSNTFYVRAVRIEKA